MRGVRRHGVATGGDVPPRTDLTTGHDMTDKTAAEVAKLEAETAEIAARTVRTAKLAEAHEAREGLRLEALQLEVEQARRDAALKAILLTQAERNEQVVKSDWRHQRTFNFGGSVNGASVQSCIDRLHEWSVVEPGCAMEIVFNSPGGSVIDGLALFDYIRYLRGRGHRVTIVALGYAASMAGILLQAGDVRIMAKGSWLLIHEVAFGAEGKIGEVEDMYKFGERLKAQAAAIFIERSGGKLTAEILTKNWTRKDWWLSPDEALALGLIDEIR